MQGVGSERLIWGGLAAATAVSAAGTYAARRHDHTQGSDSLDAVLAVMLIGSIVGVLAHVDVGVLPNPGWQLVAGGGIGTTLGVGVGMGVERLTRSLSGERPAN